MRLLQQHQLYLEVLNDGDEALKDVKVDYIALELPPVDFDEYQFYIHAVGFSLVHLIAWYNQLNHAVVMLDHFQYRKNKDIGVSGADHLIYNVENYLIRVQSVRDRLDQLINKVFHLCIDESEVKHRLVMTNLFVARTKVPQVFEKLDRYLQSFSQSRNTIIHKHSVMDLELRKIQLMYLNNKLEPSLRLARFRFLKNTILNKRKEFAEINGRILQLTIPILDELLKEYRKQKLRLYKVVYGSDPERSSRLGIAVEK